MIKLIPLIRLSRCLLYFHREPCSVAHRNVWVARCFRRCRTIVGTFGRLWGWCDNINITRQLVTPGIGVQLSLPAWGRPTLRCQHQNNFWLRVWHVLSQASRTESRSTGLYLQAASDFPAIIPSSAKTLGDANSIVQLRCSAAHVTGEAHGLSPCEMDLSAF